MRSVILAQMGSRTLDPRLDALARRVNARFDAPVIRVGPGPAPPIPAVSTAFDALDSITGFGGLPQGRLTDLVGRPTSGRTAVVAHAVAATPGYTAWVDVSGHLDVDQLARYGADLERLFILRPQKGEDALGIYLKLVTGGHFGLAVLDSLADLAPGGPTGRVVDHLARSLMARLGSSSTAAVILTAPEHHYKPIAHAAALRIGFSPLGVIRLGGVLRGWRTEARILKGPGRQGAEVGLELWLV